MLRSIIHAGTVTQADLHYVGSVTVDLNLLDAADILPGELVSILDITNGARLETYVIAGERGSGVIGINGAAAHLVHVGDKVELLSYTAMNTEQAKAFMPAMVHVGDQNSVVSVAATASAPLHAATNPNSTPARRIGHREKDRAFAWSCPIPD